MLAVLFAVLSLVQVVDASTGRSLPIAPAISHESDSRVAVVVSGASAHYADFHGTFDANAAPAQIRLLRLTADEERELARVNAFRGGFGLAPLVADENLMETARYWAREEQVAGRIGHTCEALGHPAACVEFNAYFHALPGAPQDWFAGQNAAFDTISSWLAPESGFENERLHSGERGHFMNLIDASRWVGFGETRVPGYGNYFAMNLL